MNIISLSNKFSSLPEHKNDTSYFTRTVMLKWLHMVYEEQCIMRQYICAIYSLYDWLKDYGFGLNSSFQSVYFSFMLLKVYVLEQLKLGIKPLVLNICFMSLISFVSSQNDLIWFISGNNIFATIGELTCSGIGQ